VGIWTVNAFGMPPRNGAPDDPDPNKAPPPPPRPSATATAMATLAAPVSIAPRGPQQWADVPVALKPQPTFRAIGGSSPNDLWASGDEGGLMSLFHFDGQAWSIFGAKGAYVVDAFWFASPTSGWAVSGRTTGNVMRWDGKTWTSSVVGTRGLR